MPKRTIKQDVTEDPRYHDIMMSFMTSASITTSVGTAADIPTL